MPTTIPNVMPIATCSSGAVAGMISEYNHAIASSPSSTGRSRFWANSASQNAPTASATAKIGKKYSDPWMKHATQLSAS